MQKYEIKKGHGKNIEGNKLRGIIKEIFGNFEEKNGRFELSYKAIAKMTTWQEKNFIFVDMTMNKDVDDITAKETISAYNKFLESATGFTAKERIKKIRKEAEKGG
ncbi:MAG: DUF5611 family protein [Candidatus Thermoplasmatota archaeon]